MRSIIKSQMMEAGHLSGFEVTNRPYVKKQKQKHKKKVRFDDMILIGDNEANISVFLSDEEASIVDKKSTPTRLNMQSSPELRKRLKQEMAQQRNEQKRPLPKDQLTIDKVIESKRKRTQTARFGQVAVINSGQNTKPCSPEDDKANESSGLSSSSPEKQEMSSEYDYSYDGDSDMANQQRSGSSKLKNRRRNKKYRKEDKHRRSPSPSKYGKQRYDDFQSSSEKEGRSQVEQARMVA